MDLEARLAAIENNQSEILQAVGILQLLIQGEQPPKGIMSLKDAAEYVGYSPDHFRRLAVEQRLIPFTRPSGQQKGKILFRKADLDQFLDGSKKLEQTISQPGRKRKSKNIHYW
ncbi:MAG: helix-turn-helix domain-containing protein [Pseudomonadota bacterium]